jgi:hypothetical protein
MFHSILREKARQLTRKSQQRLKWWSRERWSSVISVTPALAEDAPLWDCDEERLASVQLFGLPPERLRENLTCYLAKPRWRQWLQYWFSSVSQQFKVWSYYQQCLAFREIRQREPEIGFDLSAAVSPDVAQYIMEKLAKWLSKNERDFEDHLSRHSVHWLVRNFESELSHYTTKRDQRFSVILQKELKKLSPADAAEVAREIQRAYQKFSNSIRDYLLLWHHRTYFPQFNAHTSVADECRLTVAVVATESSALPVRQVVQLPRDAVVAGTEEWGMHSRSADAWIDSRRKQLRAILEKKEENGVERVASLLKESLSDLISFTELQLACCQKTISEVLEGKIKYQNVIKIIEKIRRRLLSFHRKSSILFHPDKHSLATASSEEVMCFTKFFQKMKLQVLEEESKKRGEALGEALTVEFEKIFVGRIQQVDRIQQTAVGTERFKFSLTANTPDNLAQNYVVAEESSACLNCKL